MAEMGVVDVFPREKGVLGFGVEYGVCGQGGSEACCYELVD